MDYINQIVILAGGKGTRMREMTNDLPKPMVEIGGIPVLTHLMNIFNHFQNFEFLICTGYLGEIIENHYKTFTNVKVLNTGIETPTGGRIKKIEEHLQDRFIVTYGDGLANVDINKLINLHKLHKKIGTITVTNPVSRFGLVEFNSDFKVEKFIEKPVLEGFINIGFMIFEKEFMSYLDESSTLESSPLTDLAKDSELYANIHHGFFEPMDTYREFLNLNKLWMKDTAPWMSFEN